MRTTNPLIKRSAAAAVAALTTVALSTGCTISLGGGDEAVPQETTQAPADQPAAQNQTDPNAAAENDANQQSAPADQGTTSQPPANNGGGAPQPAPGAQPSQIEIPSGIPINSMSMLALSGGQGETDYGKVTGVYSIDTNEPMWVTTEVSVLDEAGQLITKGESLNVLAAPERGTLITHNLVEVQEHERDRAHSFQVRVVEVKPYTNLTGVTIGDPSTGQNSTGTPTLTGSYSWATNTTSAGMEVQAACVDGNGRVYHGSHTIPSSEPSSGQYEIPMYDIEGDIGSMTCYVSA